MPTKTIKNPVNLLKRNRDTSVLGLMTHLSAFLNGAIYWENYEDSNTPTYTVQWGLFQFAQILTRLKPKISPFDTKAKITWYTTAAKIFVLPIVSFVITFGAGISSLLRNVFTNLMTHLLTYPLAILSFFLSLSDDAKYALANEIPLENIHTSTHPAYQEFDFGRLLSQDKFIRLSLNTRLFQSRLLLRNIITYPARLIDRFIHFLDSHTTTRVISLVLFPLRFLILTLGTTLGVAGIITAQLIQVLAAPIIGIINLASLKNYREYRQEMKSIEVTNLGSEQLPANEQTSINNLYNNLETDTQPKPTFKSTLANPIIGKVHLDEEDNQKYLESTHHNETFRVQLTQENSDVVLKALRTNAFRWAESLKKNNQYDQTVEALETLRAGAN